MVHYSVNTPVFQSPGENSLSEPKHDETFKVVDRRLFTSEGELRKDVAEQQDREHQAVDKGGAGQPSRKTEQAGAAATPAGTAAKPKQGGAEPAAAVKDIPKPLPAFENLLRWLGQNAAMLLGGYADPQTGQPMVDLEGAREMIDMLDALREKTRSNLTPEEDSLILDIGANLKLAYMEMTKAASAAAQGKVKSRT
jgi:Domain of unknown function (DUF1844)